MKISKLIGSILMVIGFHTLTVQAQDDEAKQLVLDYLLEADKFSDSLAYRFRCQIASSRDGGEPLLIFVDGVVAKSVQSQMAF